MFTTLRAGIVSTIGLWLAPLLTRRLNDVELAPFDQSLRFGGFRRDVDFEI